MYSRQHRASDCVCLCVWDCEYMNRLTRNRSETLSRIRSALIPSSTGDLTCTSPPGRGSYTLCATPSRPTPTKLSHPTMRKHKSREMVKKPREWFCWNSNRTTPVWSSRSNSKASQTKSQCERKAQWTFVLRTQWSAGELRYLRRKQQTDDERQTYV